MSKKYTYEDAVKLSTEYFGGDSLAAEVFVTKYALRNEKHEILESIPEQMHRRLAKEFARIEQNYPNPMLEDEIFGLFDGFKYIVPQGSPMFGIGNVFQISSIGNCFAIATVDSYGGICRADERIAQISKRRGGVGIDVSVIRPKGLTARNSALTTDGIVVFMERFSNTSREVAQSGRRGALMISLSVHHPEVINFIKAKLELNKITGANISVRVTDEFMDAVRKNKNYEQRWPVDSETPSIVKKVKAKEVWDEIIKCAHKSGEPGVLFWDNIIKNGVSDSYQDVGFQTVTTNPCVVGDTKVYVADGRGNVSIKELSEKGDDVPVFCYNKDGEVCVRTMRNPRITGYKEKIYKIKIDNGHVIRCTGNHKFRLKSGEYICAKDLKRGDSLSTIVRNEYPMPTKINYNNPSLYYWINNGICNTRAEHRYIMDFYNGEKINKKQIVHHKDYNGRNNSIENLEILTERQHSGLHSSDKMGDKNPMRIGKKEWTKEKWETYRKNMSNAVKEDKNGRYCGSDNEALKEKAIQLTKFLGRRFSKKEWMKYARENNLPVAFSNWRKKTLGSVLSLSKTVAIELGMDYIDEDPRVVKTLDKMLRLDYDAFIKDGKVFVRKKCEECGSPFVAKHLAREVSFCSSSCTNSYVIREYRDRIFKDFELRQTSHANKIKNKQCDVFCSLKNKNNKIPMRKEWEQECKNLKVPRRLDTKYGFKDYNELVGESENYNHRVVSVEEDGYETVYNGTVDDFHNFFTGGFESESKNHKYKKWTYVNNLNCGELPLGKHGDCVLLLQNLSSYVENPFTKDAILNKKLLEQNTYKAQRLIDDMVDLEIEAVEKIIKKIQSDPEDDIVKENELSLWKEVKDICSRSRRTGLGITGLGDCIAMMNLKYGSDESIKLVEEIFEIIRNSCYSSSVELAVERGPFPEFDWQKEKDNVFINRLPEKILKKMRKHGRRNMACQTISPAGSVSVLTRTTSGFEPVYMTEYKRKRKLSENDKEKPDFTDELGDKWKEYTVTHNGLKLFKEINPKKDLKQSPYYKAQAEDIDYFARVKLQATAQKYICHAISSTINLPNKIDIETVDKLYMKAWEDGCKGLTVYRDGSRNGVLSKTSSRDCEDCDSATLKLKEIILQGQRPSRVMLSTSPKRNDILECEIHRSKVGGGDWLFFVGMLNSQPYEVFGGDAVQFTIPHKYRSGWICKNGKNKDGISQYNLVLGSLTDPNEKLEFKGIAKHFNNWEYGSFTRTISLALRHGIPIKYICEQLVKTGCEGDLWSFQRAMARILKKYIADGEKTGVECPMCKSEDVYYKAGCPVCKVCGHSNCM